MKPHTQPILSYTLHPSSPPKSMWSISGRGSAPRMLRGKLIPGGLAKKGQRKWIAVHYRESPVMAVPVGVSGGAGREVGREARRSDWAPAGLSCLDPSSPLSVEREEMVEWP